MQLDVTAARAEVETIRRERYPDAKAVFLCGSLVRGDATETSDIDLVVVYAGIRSAFRESFRSGRWPVEAFVHDQGTLNYFFEKIDRPTGVPSLADMIVNGLQVPSSSEAGDAIQRLAAEAIERGPRQWTSEDRDDSRYTLTNLLDDLRAPRSRTECQATLCVLYGALAEHYFRSRNKWSAKGKAIPRALKRHDPQFAKAHASAFDKAFSDNDMSAVERLAQEVLAPDGGELFETYRRDAPEAWRLDQ